MSFITLHKDRISQPKWVADVSANFRKSALAVSQFGAGWVKYPFTNPYVLPDGLLASFGTGKLGRCVKTTTGHVPLNNLAIPSGSDFTIAITFDYIGKDAGNPGFFRDGSTFCILSDGTQPWIRWDGVDILKGSSKSLSLGNTYTIIYSIKSGYTAKVALDGEIIASITHSIATPAFTISKIGEQSFDVGSQIISGNYYQVSILNRALSDIELKSLSSNPWQIFEPESVPFYFNAVSGGGGGGISLSGISSSIYSYNLFNTLNTNVTSLSSSSQIGTLSKTLNTNVTSNAITSSVTPLASSIGKGLTGNNIISSLGNVTVFVLGDLTLALFGNSLTAVLSALSVIRSTNATGINSTTISGSLGSTVTTTLSSSLLQAAQNQVKSSVSKSLLGSLLNGSLGFLQILDGSIVLPLTGRSLFLTQGEMLPLITKGISGTSLVLSLGQITSLKEKLLPGQSAIFSQGSTGLVVSKTATGSIILSGQGSVLFADANITTTLSGSSFTSLQGVLSVFGDVEPIITKVVVQGTSYTLITFNTLNKIIT